MDRDYRVVARGHNIVIDEVRGDDIGGFPIEKARFRSIWYFIGATGCCTVGYGWALHFRTVCFITTPVHLGCSTRTWPR